VNGEGVFDLGERGYHLLFDHATLTAALGADPDALREIVLAHRDELEAVLAEILGLVDTAAARALIEALPAGLRHVLVHLYFEILEGRMRRDGVAAH
jgi:hypothetical protein